MAYKKGQAKRKVNPNVYYVACYVDKTTYEALQAHTSVDINTSTVIRGALKEFLFIDKTLPKGTHKKEMQQIMAKVNYYVIGGQYKSYCYGGAPTLIGAKRLANKHKEYWYSRQEWHTPQIYRAEDVETAISNGRITSRDGATLIVPKYNVDPVE